MYKLVIFDLDDTLIDTWGATFPHSLQDALLAMKKKGLEIKNMDVEYDRLSKINSESQDTVTALTKYLNELGIKNANFIEAGRKAVHEYDLEDWLKERDGAIDLINYLVSKRIDIVIVTKGVESKQLKKMDAVGFNRKYFKRILVVSDYNKTKPYKSLLDEFGYHPNEILVVGDRVKTDLIPAKKLGFHTVWVPHGRGQKYFPEDGETNYIIHDFSDIKKLFTPLQNG